MRAFFKQILFFGGIVSLLAMAMDTKATDNWAEGVDERKSDYIYMEALRQNALGNEDAYSELLNRAYELDTTNTDVGFLSGFYKLAVAGQDSILFSRGYEMTKRHFDAQPGDLYSSYFYGNLNNRMGRRDEALRVWHALDSIYPTKSEMALKYAEALSATTDTADLLKSIDIINRIERAEGKMIELSTHKIRNYYAMKDTANILGEIDELLASSPTSSQYHIFAADLYSLLGKNDNALNYYNKACELDSTNGAAFYARANYYHEVGDSAGYDREVFHALKLESLELEAKLQLLTGYIRELYTDSTQHERIEGLFSVLLEQHPHEADIHDLYCSYLIAIEDYPRAAEQAGIVIDMNPSSEDRWRALMGLYMQSNDYQRAIETGERALRYFPEHSTIYLIEGSCYMSIKDYPNALEKLHKSLEYADSTDYESVSSILGTIGDTYSQMEQKDSAYTYYEKALRVNPDNLLILNNYAYYLSVEGRDLDKAEAMSAITIEKEPENANSLDTYAWIMFKKKDYARAKEYIDRAMQSEEDSNSAELWEHAGDIYFMNGEPEQALEYWQRAIEINPDSELLQRKVKHKTYFFK